MSVRDSFLSRCQEVIGRSLDALDTPAVIVDLNRLERNVAAMAQMAVAARVALRPHTKSHETAAIAQRQIAAGASGITVAKLDEAEAYLASGIEDIFVANEVAGPHKWRRTAALQQRGRVAVGVDSLHVVNGLADAARSLGVTIPVLIEIDTGLHRAGLEPGESVAELAAAIVQSERSLQLRGVFTHAGHAYGAHSRIDVERIGRAEADGAVEAASRIRRRGIECPVVSVGLRRRFVRSEPCQA